MTRTDDPEELRNARELLGDVVGYDPDELVRHPNVLLKDGDNLGLFEYDSPGVYSGHYLFRSGGAYERARAMIACMFSEHGARVIKGLTPVDNTAALRLTRKLGFTSYGTIDTVAGEMELSILTKDDV
jgi:hypothetical protein